MMTDLLNFPLLLMLAILPLTCIAAWLLQTVAVRRRFVAVTPLVVAGSAILVIVILSLLLYAFLYLLSPARPVDTEPEAPIIALIYGLIPSGAVAAGLVGLACLLLSMTLIVLSIRQRFRQQWLPCVVAVGYFSTIALYFISASDWSMADSIMSASAALGLYTCLMRPRRIAWLVCGIALGIAAGSEVIGAVFFLPYLAWFFDRDGYRAPLVTLLAAAVTVLLLFLSVGEGSLLNYLAMLRAASSYGIDPMLFLQNLVFMLVPVLCFLVWQLGSVGIRSWFLRRKLVSVSAVAAALLILLACSRPGSGPHCFLPFLPALALLTTVAVSDVFAYRPTTGWSVYGFWAPLAAFLAVALIRTVVVLYVGLNVVFVTANS